ncbi:MAG: hypothetical protein LBK58_04280 [Prevotellaceae bacterium]|jgi:hypothetical protein|nr:hypothetical protein [Prevotellaceae bacterium]
MATSGTDFNKYAEAWAEMMITIWKEKMEALGIHDTGALEDSLDKDVLRQAGGDVSKINHVFHYYGHYVARGVGKEFKRGNPGDLGFTPTREPKPWISGKYWYSKNKLMWAMLDYTGEMFLVSISDILTDTK